MNFFSCKFDRAHLTENIRNMKYRVDDNTTFNYLCDTI